MPIDSIFHKLYFKHFEFLINDSTYSACNGNLNLVKNNTTFIFEWGSTICEKTEPQTKITSIKKIFRLICNFNNLSIYISILPDKLYIQLLNGGIYKVQFDHFNLISAVDGLNLVSCDIVNLDLLPTALNSENLSLFKTLLPEKFLNLDVYFKVNTYFAFDFNSRESILSRINEETIVFVHIFCSLKKVSVKIFQNKTLTSYLIEYLYSKKYFLKFDEFIEANVEIQNFNV